MADAELSAAAAVICFRSSSPSELLPPLEVVFIDRSLSSEPLSPELWLITPGQLVHQALLEVRRRELAGHVRLLVGEHLKVEVQKFSLVTATKSHCLHLNFFTWPCEFTFGLRIPSSSSLPSYDASSQSDPPWCSSFIGVSFVSLGDFGGVTSIGGVCVGVRAGLVVYTESAALP
uniref:Uncharacterized protein n=1 Tax=Anopheles atroparvus TaxID=41427 RepID=A0A182J305_ANOAO